MKTLTVSVETFMTMLSGLIKSGVTFEAKEIDDKIFISFTGGYWNLLLRFSYNQDTPINKHHEHSKIR